MPNFLVDECLLGLYTPRHQAAYAAQGWGHGAVGYVKGLPYSTPDNDVYQYAITNGYSHIITSNRKDFTALQKQLGGSVVIVDAKRIYPPDELIIAIKYSLHHNPSASLILIGQILTQMRQASGSGTP